MPKIKICGLTNLRDYDNAASFGADYTGFIFYKGSKRYINEEQALDITMNGTKFKNRKVGIFVNEDIEEIRRIYKYSGLDIVQLHGDEEPGYCEKLGLPYWKVIRIKNEDSIRRMDDYKCNTFLIDTYNKDAYGGTGTAIDTAVLKKILSTGRKIIVAGGLNINNIEQALELNPFGIDINSGIEKNAGIKDIYKMKQIIEKIKGYKNGE